MNESPQPHRIAKLQLKVAAPSQQQAFGLRAQLRQAWEMLLPELDAGLNTLAGPERWLHIAELAIRCELPPIDANMPVEQIVDLLRPNLLRAFREKLREINVPAIANRMDVPAASGSDSDDNSKKMHDGHHDKASPLSMGAVSLHDEQGQLLASLVHYIATGRLPWFVDVGRDYRPQWLELIARDADRCAAELIREPLSPAAWLRLMPLLCDGGLAGDLVGAFVLRQLDLQPGIDARRKLLAGKLLLFAADTTSLPTLFSRQQWWQLLHIVITEAACQPALLKPVLTGHRRRNATTAKWRSFVESFKLNIQDRSLLKTLLPQVFLAEVFEFPETVPVAEEVGPGRSNVVDLMEARKQRRYDNDDAEKRWSAKRNDGGEHAARVEPFAGLALLHPYLPSYFQRCGVAAAAVGSSAKAIAADHLPRACQLLVFLLTGSALCPEYQLAIPKLLLGLDPDAELVLVDDLLSDAQKSEGEQLLQSAIAHWPALKKTSVAGLRSAFLCRSGFLKAIDNGWLLKLERTGYDVLLDQLPYSYSVVKLPWMPYALHIDW